MAKSRERAERAAPPPRMTGMGILQVTLINGFAAVVISVVGVLAAGGQSDPTASQAADSLGAGLVTLLTSTDPSTWRERHGTTADMLTKLKKWYPELQTGAAKDPKGRGMQNFLVSDRNKKRLLDLDTALRSGALRGIQIRATNAKALRGHTVGARIHADQFQSQRKIGDVSVASMPAKTSTMNFTGRVYHRPFKDLAGHVVGDAYVILSESALKPKGGAGMWLILTPLLVFAAIGMILIFAAKFAEGARGLARDLDMIGRGRLDLRVATNAPAEMGFLQRTADRMAKNLQLITTTGSGNLDEALEKELDLTSQIHASLRPSDPPRLPGYELETIFRGGRDIGGDYHDYIELDENRIALIIADCSENLRGVPAAMVMAMTRAYLRTAIDASTGPAAWLKLVNRRLAGDLKSGMAVTAQIVVVDTSTDEAVAASAGHRPLVLWRQGKTATINPNGIALGLDIGPVFEKTMEEKKFSFQRNDRIVLYTDGVISAENEKGETYGEANFLETIRRQGAMNSAAFVNFVAGGVDKFLAGAEQNDDLTICTLKRMK